MTRKNKAADKPAKMRALEILNYKLRTEKELRGRLFEDGYDGDEIDEALEYVKGYGYVNDENYARLYAESKAALKGRRAIKTELEQRGIAAELIELALLELETDEEDAALGLLIKKAGEPHILKDKEYARLGRFLAGRGFSGSVLYGALKRYSMDVEDL